jgi:trans-aconitate 2-methyltransferase
VAPSTDWDPAQYERFRDERSQPFWDLAALVRARPGMRVVDLGCGPGTLTAALHQRIGARETLGIDSSPAMLARAQSLAGGGLRFERGDLATFAADGAYDLVLSNAALHWAPAGEHAAVLTRWTAALAPGGQLAVQVPSNFDHVSHRLADEVAGEAPFREALGDYQRGDAVLDPAEYARLLFEQHVRLQVYVHKLGAREDVIEWVKGTLLTSYQSRLPADLWPRFLERYRAALLPRLDDTHPFFYPYKRILFWGQR